MLCLGCFETVVLFLTSIFRIPFNVAIISTWSMKQVITCLWWFYFSTPDPSTGILMTIFYFIYNIKCLVLQHMEMVLTQPVCYVTAACDNKFI